MKRLQTERQRRGWTQTQLAAAAGLHQAQVSLIENGRTVPTEDQLARLADALEVSPRDLCPDRERAQRMERA